MRHEVTYCTGYGPRASGGEYGPFFRVHLWTAKGYSTATFATEREALSWIGGRK